tara:strand:- start:2507 stop:3451 length:945 start_codon:yes stop_codon:yes gene_type:complete
MAKILADHQFTLLDFENIKNEFTIKELDTSVIAIINQIANRVGAPNYQKTPVFKKKDRRHFQKKVETINETKSDFKKTELEKNTEGIEAEIDKLRSLLNKMTKKNYDDVSKRIINNIQFIIKFETENIEETLIRIGNCIFDIGGSNKFLSDIYSSLYKDLINDFPCMKSICEKNYESYLKLFENIYILVDSDDYDAFCECNKIIEKRRSMSCFLINLVNKSVLEPKIIISLLKNIVNQVKENINILEKKNEIEELVEILSIFIINGYNSLQITSEYSDIIDFIEDMSEYNSKDYNGLSNKTIFKCVDVIEEIDD